MEGKNEGAGNNWPSWFSAIFSAAISLVVFGMGWLHVEVRALREDLGASASMLDRERKELQSVTARRDVIEQAMDTYDSKISHVNDTLEARLDDLQNQIRTVSDRQLEESSWRMITGTD